MGWITLPCLGVLFGLDALLTALGLSPAERPLGLRVPVALLFAAPGLLWWVGPALAGVPGFGWLADRRPLSLTLDGSGFTLRHGEEARSVAWDDVSRLLIWDGGMPTAKLVLRDGRDIRLPGELVYARRADGERTNLLEEIDRYRPQLARLAERRRQAQIIFWAGMCVFVPLGLVGLYVLYIRQ